MENPQPSNTKRILIVDDSPKARVLIESILRGQGYSELTNEAPPQTDQHVTCGSPEL
jgi:CheY-like chemotaxis protein